jgi:phosphate transport system substrate-binding protein
MYSWPITMGTFVVVPFTAKNPDTAAATLRFFTWAFMKGDKLVGDVDFVRLPDMVQARIYGDLTRVSDVKGQPLKWVMPH